MSIQSEIQRVEKGCKKKNHFAIDDVLFEGKEKCGYYIPNTNTIFYCEECKIKLKTLKFAQSETDKMLQAQKENFIKFLNDLTIYNVEEKINNKIEELQNSEHKISEVKE